MNTNYFLQAKQADLVQQELFEYDLNNLGRDLDNIERACIETICQMDEAMEDNDTYKYEVYEGRLDALRQLERGIAVEFNQKLDGYRSQVGYNFDYSLFTRANLDSIGMAI